VRNKLLCDLFAIEIEFLLASNVYASQPEAFRSGLKQRVRHVTKTPRDTRPEIVPSPFRHSFRNFSLRVFDRLDIRH
jgi:hypothetical protein